MLGFKESKGCSFALVALVKLKRLKKKQKNKKNCRNMRPPPVHRIPKA
jgi:hypothetical protein